MLAVIILSVLVVNCSGVSKSDRKCLDNDVKKPTDYLWPDKTVNYVLDKSLNGHKSVKKAIRKAIQEWQDLTCVKFKDYTAKDLPQNKNILRFTYGNRCAGGEQVPMRCNCERIISVHESCKEYTGISISWHLGLTFQPQVGTTLKKITNTISDLYKCNEACLFQPVCHNGGYVVPEGKGGCGVCVCPEGEDCQESDDLEPNDNLLTDIAVEGMGMGVEKAFSKLEDKMPDKFKGHISGGAKTMVTAIANGEAETIPGEIASDIVQDVVADKLGDVLSKFKLGGAVAAGLAAAAGSIVSDVFKGDFENALKNAISTGLGTFVGEAIGSVIGTALGGPLGTIIGGIIGGIIADLVSDLVKMFLDVIWPYLKDLFDLVLQALKEVWKFIVQVWESFVGAMVGFANAVIDFFG